MSSKRISTIFLIISSILMAAPKGNHATSRSPRQTDNSWFQSICQGKENKGKIHFYVHDIFTGENQNVFEVASASITSNSPTSFGEVLVSDIPLTVDVDINSKEVGRVQGLVTSADSRATAYALNLNFVFTVGVYNGSTISLVGRNQPYKKENELPIVGGTGVFRSARGYGITRALVFNEDIGIVEYTLYVTYGGDSSTSYEAKQADLGWFN